MADFRPPAIADEGSMKSQGGHPPAYLRRQVIIDADGWADLFYPVRQNGFSILLYLFSFWELFYKCYNIVVEIISIKSYNIFVDISEYLYFIYKVW